VEFRAKGKNLKKRTFDELAAGSPINARQYASGSRLCRPFHHSRRFDLPRPNAGLPRSTDTDVAIAGRTVRYVPKAELVHLKVGESSLFRKLTYEGGKQFRFAVISRHRLND
jgi:hypothetical protein